MGGRQSEQACGRASKGRKERVVDRPAVCSAPAQPCRRQRSPTHYVIFLGSPAASEIRPALMLSALTSGSLMKDVSTVRVCPSKNVLPDLSL